MGTYQTRTNMGFKGHAKGAIKSHGELLDLIVEARKERKAIRLYAVEQGGHLQELFITSRCSITNSNDRLATFSYWARFGSGARRYYKSEQCLGDLNIRTKDGRLSGHNRHQLFTNSRHANEYAAELKNDAAYQTAVAEWHDYCARVFDWP